jgi:hypothetical protein
MTALGNADRELITLARTLARADRREDIIAALRLAESPTLDIHADELDTIGFDTIHAAGFGTLQGIVERLAEIAERLDGQLAQAAEMLAEDSTREADYYLQTAAGLAAQAARRVPGCYDCTHGAHDHPAEDAPSNPVPSRSVWRVDESVAQARELGQYPGPQADRQARELNGHASTRPHVHYMSLPLGGSPFDYETEADRRNALAEDPDPMGLDGYRDTARDSR